MQKFEPKRLKHSYLLLYPILYMMCFLLLERYIKHVHIIEVPLDSYIPFCEYFILPYYAWFAYVAVTAAFFFFFVNLEDMYRLFLHLFLGMTLFLIISALYPNGLALRPETFPRDNFCTLLVKALYKTDTATNVLPSIHVYNSVCVHIAIAQNECLQRKKWIVPASFILMALIILSTMFLKQHSIVDVVSGIVLALLGCPLFYKWFHLPKQDSLLIKSI